MIDWLFFHENIWWFKNWLNASEAKPLPSQSIRGVSNIDWPLVLLEDFPAAAKFCYELDQTIDTERKQMEADIPVGKFKKAKSRNNKREKVREKKESVEKFVDNWSWDWDLFLIYYIF